MCRIIFILVCLVFLVPAVPSAVTLARPAGDASYYASAIALDAAGKKNEAVEQLRKALKIKPAHGPYLNMLGSLCYDLGKYPEAVKNLEAARKYDPQKVWYYYLAKSLFKSGRLEEARKAAATGSRLEPQKGRQLELIKLGKKIRTYLASFSAAKAAFARKSYSDAATELQTARGLIDTEEAKKLDEEIAGATAAGDFSLLMTAARQALKNRDLAGARNALTLARQLFDNEETKRLYAEIEKAGIFQRHMKQADAMLQEKNFKAAREEAADALAVSPGEEAKKKTAEVDKAEQDEQFRLHLEKAKALLAGSGDYPSVLNELTLAAGISETDEVRQLLTAVSKMQTDQSYKRHYDRAAGLFSNKDYEGAIAEFKAAAAIVKTDTVGEKIAEAEQLRAKGLRNKRLLWGGAGLGLLALLLGAGRLLTEKRKVNHSLAALANIIDAMKLSDFRKAMLEYSGFKAAGGRPEDIPSGEMFALFSGAGAVNKLSEENVPADYLLECALQLAGKNRTAEAFQLLGEGAVLKKISLPPDFAAFINIYARAGKLADIGTLLEKGGFAPETYSGLAAAMLDLQQNEQGVRILQAKRKFHELQKVDSDLLFAFTRKPGV
jgi:hypothetical protein